MIRPALFGLLLAVSLPVTGQIYSYIDEHGNRVFTDRPGTRAAEKVQPKPSNTMPSVRVQTTPPRQAPAEKSVALYQQLEVLQPAPDATIRDNAGTLVVSVHSEPPLQPGHEYRLLLDGAPAATGSEAVLGVDNVDRGTHQLAVQIIDSQGTPLAHSGPRVFHMMRTSLAQRRMAQPCEKDDYGVRPECPLRDKPAEKFDIPFVPFF